jgi:two-component system nitrate/nitrite response regulator NarL
MPNVKPIRILIADDHPIFRDGLRRLLESQQGFHVVGEAGEGNQTVALTKQLKPDVLLLDVAMPGLNGIEALRQLSHHPVAVNTILLTAGVEKPQVLEALRLGARGVVVKGSQIDLLLASIRAVMAGQFWIGHESVADLVDYFRGATLPGNEPENRFGLTTREREIISENPGRQHQQGNRLQTIHQYRDGEAASQQYL